jgi:hypothetical protein
MLLLRHLLCTTVVTMNILMSVRIKVRKWTWFEEVFVMLYSSSSSSMVRQPEVEPWPPYVVVTRAIFGNCFYYDVASGCFKVSVERGIRKKNIQVSIYWTAIGSPPRFRILYWYANTHRSSIMSTDNLFGHILNFIHQLNNYILLLKKHRAS